MCHQMRIKNICGRPTYITNYDSNRSHIQVV